MPVNLPRLNGYLRAVDWQRNGGIYLSIKLIDRPHPSPLLAPRNFILTTKLCHRWKNCFPIISNFLSCLIYRGVKYRGIVDIVFSFVHWNFLRSFEDKKKLIIIKLCITTCLASIQRASKRSKNQETGRQKRKLISNYLWIIILLLIIINFISIN